MKDGGWFGNLGKRWGRGSIRTKRFIVLLASCAVLVAVVTATLSLSPNAARGEESASGEPQTTTQEILAESLPTAEQTKELLGSADTDESTTAGETDPQVAQELPHHELDGTEALELAEGVFGEVLEEPAGVYDELEPEKFLSNYAAVVPASSIPDPSGEEKGSDESAGPEAPPALGPTALLESTLPLRTENDEGEEEVVDLGLEEADGSGGALEPQNPLTELEIPAHLDEGVSVGKEIQIEVPQAAGEVAPTNVEGQYAFYPNVSQDTDLIIAPTARGVETMTDVRSADAPKATTYRLSLPAGASLEATRDGGAEVVQGDRTIMVVPPPTATDAAGNQVPVRMQVEGDELVASISTDQSTAYPVLVDPWYNTETWCWSSCGQPFAGWTGGSSNPSYAALPYAQWDPSHYPGLDLTSGFPGPAYRTTHADWSYWVPRYYQDTSRFGSAPTSWVAYMRAEGVLFLPFGNSADYPVMVIGLVEPATGWAPGAWSHYGGEGELSNWGSIDAFNPPQNRAVKGADLNLVTYVEEPQAKYRSAFLGGATIYVADADAPSILELKSPSGWITGSSATLPYRFEDTGLGIHGASIRLQGEASPHPWWGANFACTGASASPCPRVVGSGEAGAPPLGYNPIELPTGKDRLEVTVADPLEGEGHEATSYVNVQVDNSGPEIALSGALTEQETKGTRLAEYPLAVNVTDGSKNAPQSGVAAVEVKVDGKKITMANETPWHPACKTENCSVSGTWTLKSSEYAAGTHEVEVVASDAVGNVSATTLEVETGQGPPQTSFTSPHPTYESHEIPSISFKATREGAPVEGATFRCSLDGKTETPTKPCTSPYTLPGHLAPKEWHVLLVQAVDKSGKVDPTPARWRFQTGEYPAVPGPAAAAEKLVYPEVGKKTASYYTLEAEWGANPEGKAGQGVSGVFFEMELPGEKSFQPVPAGCVIDGQGRQVSWPLPTHTNPGHNQPVYLKVRGCPVFEKAGYPEKEIQFRAVFDGGEKVAGTSSPSATEFVYTRNPTRVSTDAVEEVGPATVDLLTGAFTMSRTDVSIPVPGYEANLEFTRVYKSSQFGTEPGYSNILGGTWQPSMPLESEFEGQAWARVEEKEIPAKPAVYGHECWTEQEKEVGPEEFEVFPETTACPPDVATNCNPSSCEAWEEEEAQPREAWVELIDNEGAGIPFEISGSGLVAPDYAKELKLTRGGGGNYVLSYPNGTRTTFVRSGSESPTYLPETISYQANPGSMRMVYAPEGKTLRLLKEIAPSSFGCPDAEVGHTEGCRSLEFRYENVVVAGQTVKLLESIAYYGAMGGPENGTLVAGYSYGEITNPEGKKEMVLTGEGDPRIANSTEFYAYAPAPASAPSSTLLTTIAPPGQQQPWYLHYEYRGSTKPCRLASVERAGTKTTLAYEVPVQGSGAPYDMSSAGIGKWGQTDLPVDATAIFPSNHVPSKYPPTEYTGATVHYMDPEGHQVNVASPSPPGVSGSVIATTETDVKGNVVRELTPRNRLTALESTQSAARSRELDTHSVYNANGTAMLESWGPTHEVRTQAGEIVQARRHTTISYDEHAPDPPPGTPPAYLPTKETVGAVVQGTEAELEPKVTETRYDWKFRKPTETIVDPNGLIIRSVTVYNAAGQVIETRQPKGAAGGTGGDTRYFYYDSEGCQETLRYAHLPCLVVPAKQVTGAGRPEIPLKIYPAYNNLDEPTQVTEFSNGTQEGRKTETTYDAAGRTLTTRISGGGVEVPKSEIQYSLTLLMPVKQQSVCEKECTGFNPRATTTTYNNLGQVTKYEDADGNVTETTYDAYGRPATVKDARGTEILHYDEASGLLTSMEVSGVGTFTATYDADGNLIARGLPNGLTARTTYNAADEPMKLTYTKTSSCGESCTWYEESLERSIEGRILTGTSTLVKNRYSYDNDGRLTEAQEIPTGGQCTSRAYTFDADSNRLTRSIRTGIGGACATSGGTTQNYQYDEADRLMGTGTTYDAWGRITSLPGEYTGGKALTTSYFSNNMVATQSQGGVTNTFQLDATGRQRQREQAGGVAGVEVFHYDGHGDAPSWTALGSTWSRNVPGIGGELAAIQESTGTTTFKLTDLHGDVVAAASSSTTATKLLSTYRYSEFGEPLASGINRFGWLGGKGRRTELASGVIQMGARSYIPQLGRFLTPDPLRGASSNAYDYSDQDPVNVSDLSGERPKRKNRGFSGFIKAAAKAAARAVNRNHHRVVAKAERRLASLSLPSLPSTVFLEPSPSDSAKAAKELVNTVSTALSRQTQNELAELGSDISDYLNLHPNERLQQEAECGHEIVESWAAAGPDKLEGILLGVTKCIAYSLFS